MNDLVPIPPLARTVIYYVLALANAVVTPLAAAGVLDPTIAVVVLGVASTFGFVLSSVNTPTKDPKSPDTLV